MAQDPSPRCAIGSASPPPRGPTRRRLLGLTVAGLAGAAVLRVRSTPPAPPAPGFLLLSPTEARILGVFCAAALPAEGNAAGLYPWTRLPVLESVDLLLFRQPRSLQQELRRGLQLLDYGAVLRHGARFQDLNAEDARATLTAWSAADRVRRGLTHALRQAVALAYWREPETWPAIDYDGPVVAKWGLPSLGNAPLPARYGGV